MEITWWGTSAFRIKTGGIVFLIDPYVSRNSDAEPYQYLESGRIVEGKHIFLTHGHFDHAYDVPVISRNTRAKVYCADDIIGNLIDQGVPKHQIKRVKKNGESFNLGAFIAQAFHSAHVKPDLQLISKTLLKVRLKAVRYFPLFRSYPPGQVLSWRFAVEDKFLHFFGSAGSSAEELERVSSLKTDILFVPLQGHTHIHDLALEYVQVCQPKIVIPHHHDNFFPPVSRKIDLEPFIEGVKRECPNTKVQVMDINETIIV